MRLLPLFLILICSTSAFAQLPPADTYPLERGTLTIQPILHGTLVLSWEDQVIYVDPYGGADRFKESPKPTIILITDIHGDHLNQETLDGLDTKGVVFLVPQAVAYKLPDAYQAQIKVIGNGENLPVNGIDIAALPMYNLPDDESSRHPKGRGNGYVLSISDKQVYLSGDTEDIPEMRSLNDIDIAFVCMNLPFTMDVDQAADAVLEFKPKVVYPYHYRGREGLSDVASFKKIVNEADSSIEVRLRNWYAEL